MAPDFIFMYLFGEFIVFINYIFFYAFSANYKLKIINKNVRKFHGKSHAQYLFKYVWLSEATTTATSSSVVEIDVVILPRCGYLTMMANYQKKSQMIKIMILYLQMQLVRLRYMSIIT